MKTKSIKLVAGGDVCPADHYFTIGHGFANHSIVENSLKSLKPILTSADLSIVNLECPLSQFSDADSQTERNVFRGNCETANVIKSSGINYLHIANNHILQHGLVAFNDTIDSLKAAGIQPVGLSDNNKEITPVYVSSNGLQLSLIGVSFIADPFAPSQISYDSPSAENLISTVKQESDQVDHVIVSIHWGSEGPDIPSSFEVVLGRKIIEAGASVVLGHHSHVVRPVEIWGNGLICYSLGNLLFDLDWYYPYTVGLLIEISLGSKGSTPDWIPHFTRCRGNTLRLFAEIDNKEYFKYICEKASWIEATDLRTIESKHDQMLKNIEFKQMIYKILYFFCMLPFGNTSLKILFIYNKIIKRLK